jgi:hypothetical protein
MIHIRYILYYAKSLFFILLLAAAVAIYYESCLFYIYLCHRAVETGKYVYLLCMFAVVISYVIGLIGYEIGIRDTWKESSRLNK